MSYPKLEINLRKLQHNAKYAVDVLAKLGIEAMGVNKVFNGLYETAEATVKAGVKVIAESRVDNLKKLKNLPCEKALLRIPTLSEIEDVIRYADISLNTQIEIVKALSEEAVRQKRIHRILIMLDLGDIREGIWYENKDEIEAFVEAVTKLPNIKIYGIGSNFSCYGTVLPSIENIDLLVSIKESLENKFHIKFKYVSAGNTTTYHLIDKGIVLDGVNHLRIGSMYQFGIEYVYGKYIDGFYHSSMDVNKYVSNLYIFKAEIIELNAKPTVPVGELGLDAFLQKKNFVDRGTRKRAILAFGRRDVPYQNIYPVDGKIEILGQTSDYTVVDIQDCCKVYNLGDIINFEVDYTALMQLCISSNIQKSYCYD
jgi:ornithine racemase